MTLGEFRDLTNDLSDDIELYIFVNDMLQPVCVESSGIFDLKDIDEIVESVLALSTCNHDNSTHISPISLN